MNARSVFVSTAAAAPAAADDALFARVHTATSTERIAFRLAAVIGVLPVVGVVELAPSTNSGGRPGGLDKTVS